MSFTPLVDSWHESEETRTRLRPGRRWYRMEKALGDHGPGQQYLADMTPNRHHWRHREVLEQESDQEPELTSEGSDVEVKAPGAEHDVEHNEPAPEHATQEFEDEVEPGATPTRVGQEDPDLDDEELSA